jgi:hypothetical protein
MVLDGLVSTFGPFLIPVVLFVGGVVVYAVLWYVGRTELDPGEG